MGQAETDSQNGRFRAFLENPEMVREYLDTILEEGHESLLLGMRDVINSCGGSAFFSQKTRIERALVDEVMSETGKPTLASVGEVLKAFKLRIAIVRD